MKQRFCLLNTAMRNLQDVDVASILRELPLNKPLSRIKVLTMRQQVERIKSAYDKYVVVCENVNKARHISTWFEVTANTGIITTKLYVVISMIMDQQYDYAILAHCIIWVIYRSYTFLSMVIIYSNTANEVSLSV